MKTMLNIKIDSELKKNAQNILSDLGLSMSNVLSNYLKQLVKEKRVVFSINQELNNETKEILKKSKTEEEKKESKSFSKLKDSEDFLMSL